MYRPDIDGLRALAVLSVVVFHAFPSAMRGGFVGVDIFFVISGFLISSILFSSLENSSFSFTEFYARRIRRIFPALLLVLATSLCFGWFLLIADEYRGLGKHVAAGAAFVSNFALWNESGYFDAAASQKPLLHLWSLAIEEQFYLFWPILLWLAYRRHRNFLALTLLIAAASFVLNVATISKFPVAAFYSPLSRFWELMIGGILAYLAIHRPEYLSTKSSIWSIAGLGLIFAALTMLNADSAFPGWWALMPTIGSFLIIAGGPSAWVNRRILSNRILVSIGLISYPLYLWHWPALYFASSFSSLPSRVTRTLAVLISVVLAALTYSLVERPLRNTKIARVSVTYLAIGMAACASIGIVIETADGVPSRLPPQFAQFTRSKIDDSHSECFYKDDSDFKAACTQVDRRPSLFIWGDSHADRLYFGFKPMQDRHEISILQVTGPSCPPLLNFKSNGNAKCEQINQYALARILHLHPDVVLMHANWSADTVYLSQLDGTVRELKENGVRNVVILGPVPLWNGSILRSLFRCWKPTSAEQPFPTDSTCGLNARVHATDVQLRKTAERLGVRYISAYDAFCNSSGCLTHVSEDGGQLTTYDYGHLSSGGAKYLVHAISNVLFAGGATAYASEQSHR